MSALDTQIGGGHYKGMKIQPMEYSMANGLDACQHTAIKYISRFRDKGGIQDLEKAKHCIDMLIEFEQKRAGEMAVQAVVHEISQGGPIAQAMLHPAQEETDPYGPRDAEGWYTWNGDETMRPAGRVEVQFMSRGRDVVDAGSVKWNHIGGLGDIVKWRPAQ
jgi:hypothetical protein